MIPLLLVVVFLAVSVPRYLTGNPAQSQVPATFALHYPVLVVHVLLGGIAMAAAVAQLWPGLRNRHPVLHRRTGRIYVIALLPAGVTAVVLGITTPFGPIVGASSVVLGVLWLWFTVAGYRAARAGRYGDHRRWMLRSAALTFSIISNRVWGMVLYFALIPLYDSLFGGNETHFQWALAGSSGWLGWLVPLLAVQWWLRRHPVTPAWSNSQLADTQQV